MERRIPATTNRVTGQNVPVKLGNKADWRDYILITKPGINVSNLLAVFTAMWLAGKGSINLFPAVSALVGTALVIAGGCTLNNYIDRDIDPFMVRTQNRPLACQRIRPKVALGIGITLGVMGFILLAIGVHWRAMTLAMVGFAVYVGIYSLWLKRVTPLNTAVGSVSGAIPPMIGWVAITGVLDIPAWVLFAILFFWQPPHFYALAMCRVDEYRAANIPMLPVVKGYWTSIRSTLWWVVCLVLVSFLLPLMGTLGVVYTVTAIVCGVVYLALSFFGLFVRDYKGWAKRMFVYSLIYLTMIQLAILVDVIVVLR